MSFRRKAIAGLLVLMTALLWRHPLAAAPVPVRFVEGSLHGFLVLSTLKEGPIASGDLLQVARDGEVKSRLVFHFKDGSVLDETVVFTQRNVFTLQSYHLVQRGPVFPEDTEISLERASGKYHVKTRAHKDGREKVTGRHARYAPRRLQRHGPHRRQEPLRRGRRDRPHGSLHARAEAHQTGNGTGGRAENPGRRNRKNRNPLHPQADPRNLVEALRLAAWAHPPGQSRMDRYRRCAGIRQVRRPALHERTGLADRIDEPPLARPEASGERHPNGRTHPGRLL